MAWLISSSVFPTLEYTIFSGGKPFLTAQSTSLPLTQSAPKPASRITFKTGSLAFAFKA